MTTDPAADDAMRALSDALLSMLEQDTTPPCADGSNAWTDEDHEVRAKVAPHCEDCPIRHRCHDFADTARPRITFGIFAGIDYTAATRRQRDDR
jgi:Transcription factor WhiB